MVGRPSKQAIIAILFLTPVLFSQLLPSFFTPKEGLKEASIGNPKTLLAAYDRWKTQFVRNGGDQTFGLALNWTKGLSAEFTEAHGQITFDLSNGSVSVEVIGLPETESFDVWLIDNRPGPGRSIKPELGDTMVRVGSLQHEEGMEKLQTQLSSQTFSDFQLDLVSVVRAGELPEEAGLLFGSPGFFLKLYYDEQRQFAAFHDSTAIVNPVGAPSSLLLSPFRASLPLVPTSAHRTLFSAPFQVLIPRLAYAQDLADLEDMIKSGEELFLKETFGGNGRTCGTCHPPENNFTIDKAFIKTLQRRDPLFVAESDRNLNFRWNGGLRFENPVLMRKFGLITENVDGTDDLANKFTMRSVPHMLALGTSINSGSASPPDRTGWSGDGAPFDGSLRMFAAGAVMQHAPKTMNRIANIDFVLPTDDQLDALLAFELSLGRLADPDLSTLVLMDPNAQEGQAIFRNRGADSSVEVGQCDACHKNAGANTGSGANGNFNTGVEDFLQNNLFALDPTGEPRPRDGGFGTDGNLVNGFGNGTFNTPSLVEAADTGPFFHNNSAETLEDAIRFYNSPEFNNLGGFGRPIALTDAAIDKVGAFLRVLNGLENMRAAIDLCARAWEALEENPHADIAELIDLASSELVDADQVLNKGPMKLHSDVRKDLREAAKDLKHARKYRRKEKASAKQWIERAIDKQEAVRGSICASGSDAVLCP